MVTPLTGSRNTYQGDDKLKLTASTQPHRHANAVRLPINCDYVNYAARNALRLGKNQFLTDDDTESNPTNSDRAEMPPDSDSSLKE